MTHFHRQSMGKKSLSARDHNGISCKKTAALTPAFYIFLCEAGTASVEATRWPLEPPGAFSYRPAVPFCSGQARFTPDRLRPSCFHDKLESVLHSMAGLSRFWAFAIFASAWLSALGPPTANEGTKEHFERGLQALARGDLAHVGLNRR